MVVAYYIKYHSKNALLQKKESGNKDLWMLIYQMPVGSQSMEFFMSGSVWVQSQERSCNMEYNGLELKFVQFSWQPGNSRKT